ncbi:hypothetical protein D0T56_04770 [Dysgonomonas sp. 520]|nr:hypothetical protein [Dysgonomonas sp. 520]
MLVVGSVSYTSAQVFDFNSQNVANVADEDSKVSSEEASKTKSAAVSFQAAADFQAQGKKIVQTRATNATLKASYMRPQGFFYYGRSLSNHYLGKEYSRILGYPYVETQWRNTSEGATAFQWTMPHASGSGDVYTSTSENPSATYVPTLYNLPTLEAKKDDASNYYKWGGAYSKFVGGGTPAADGRIYGAANYDYREGMWKLDYMEDGVKKGYIYGKREDKKVESVLNFFEKPATKYVLLGGNNNGVWVWAWLSVFSAPGDTEFKMTIHKVGERDDYERYHSLGVLAEATCKASEVTGNAESGYLMSFSNFTGAAVMGSGAGAYLEIEDNIMIELEGFNKDGVDFCIDAQTVNTTTEANAYIKAKDKEGNWIWDYYIDDEQTGSQAKTALSINMNVLYTYMHPEKPVIDFPLRSGGSQTIEISASNASLNNWEIKSIPDWITYSLEDVKSGGDYAGITKLTITALPLPDEKNGRHDDFVAYFPGSTMTIRIGQGDEVSGIEDEVLMSEFKAVYKGGNFELSYPTDYTSVYLYGVNGQQIAKYSLTGDGVTSIPSEDLNGGLYMFRFVSGKGISTTVKAMK